MHDYLVGIAEQLIPRELRGRRQLWITQDIKELVEQCRKFKNVSDNMYKDPDRLIEMMCIDRKEAWLQEK